MIKKRRIMIEIPEKDLEKEFGWFRREMGEYAVRVFLIKHPNIIETELRLEHFVGLNVFFASTQEADMLFCRHGTYYIVETKQKGKYSKGWEYLRATVECFEAEMKKHGEDFQEIVAVLATSSSKTVQKLSVKSLNWFS